MGDELHPAVDGYLETIGWLAEEGGPVISAGVARRLGKSKASVSEMLERLVAGGYVERADRRILLTEAGKERARGVIRRHRLAERLLVDVVGLPWRDVHAEAGRFARVISDDVVERLVDLLGDPATCPHGNPIPGSASPLPEPGRQIRLADAAPGQNVRLARITQEVELDGASLGYLDEGGFVPGVKARVLERGPDGTLVVSVGGDVLPLGPRLCERLFVVIAD
ncbi:MAG: metal-dependent transcriptional regulator [Acidimicrobiales bacterium]|jgi:DtxR family Mn-dependent transcriptional regulator